jgi:hypothetical protein
VPRSRRARPSDVGEIALSLPEVAWATVWGDLPAYQVRKKTFVIYRGLRKDALGDDGQPLEDVVMVAVANPEDKAALLASGPPWFTTSHFDGYNAVLVRESHLGQISRDELAEVVQDAWLAKAPKRLAKEWLAVQKS